MYDQHRAANRRAAALWVRSRYRRRVVGTAVVVLFAALVGGGVLACFAGARRNATAYPRLAREHHFSDVMLNPYSGAESRLAVADLQKLPFVVRTGRIGGYFMAPLDAAGNFNDSDTAEVLAAYDPVVLHPLDQPKMTAGRLFAADATDQIVVNPVFARRRHVGVGSVVTFGLVDPATLHEGMQGPPPFTRLRLRVVGIGVIGDEIVPADGFDVERVLLPNGFARAHRRAVGYWGFLTELRHGSADIRALRAAVTRAVPDEQIAFQTTSLVAARVSRSTRTQTVAIVLFGIAVALGGLLAVGQILTRRAWADLDDLPTLRSFGMSRRSLAVALLVDAGLVALAGSIGAVLVAVALSPVFPVGPARLAEPHPGVAVNAPWVAGGALVMALLILVIMVPPVLRVVAVADRGDRETLGRRPSRTVQALTRAGAPASAVTGVRFALEPGSGRRSVPVRSAIAGAAVALAAVVSALVFGAALGHLVGSPPRYGWNWDLLAEFDDAALPPIAPKLASTPGVVAVSEAATSHVVVDGRTVPAIATRVVRGGSMVTVIAGRAPGDGEIAFGGRTLRALGVHIGSTVTARRPGGSRAQLRVVGEVAFPALGQYTGEDNLELGAGAAVSTTTLDRLAEPTVRYVMARVGPGIDARKALEPVFTRSLSGSDSAPTLTWRARRPSDIVGLRRVRSTPPLLAGVLAVVALVAIGHAGVVSTRRRRRDLALLSALGFDRRQLRATVAWQATSFGVLAVVIGLVPGVVLGRWAWVLVARQIGAPEDIPLPALALALTVAGAVVLANVLAAVPARMAARVPAAEALHGE